MEHGFEKLGVTLARFMHSPFEADAPVPTGYSDLDVALGRLQRGDLLTLGGPAGVGKTALALNIARGAAGQGAQVLFRSFQHDERSLAIRLLSAEAEVDAQLLRLSLISESNSEQLASAVVDLNNIGLEFEDSPAVNLAAAASGIAEIEKPVDLVIVDGLELLCGSSMSDDAILAATLELKRLARQMNVPILATFTLAAGRERDPANSPLAASLKQHSDVVLFIHREDKIMTEDQWNERNPTKPYPENQAQIIIAKNRHGPTNTITLYFRAQYMRFENLAAEYTGV